MTKSRAEEIAEDFLLKCECGETTWSDEYRGNLKKLFAKAIADAQEEAVLEAFDNKFANEHKRCLEIAHAKGFEEGQLSAQSNIVDQLTGITDLAVKYTKQGYEKGFAEGFANAQSKGETK